MAITDPVAKFNMDDVTALFKIKYEKLSENVYNSANVLLGRVKKSYNFTGKRLSIAIPQSFAGGVGSGNLPKANKALYSDAQITAKKMYAVVEVDRETIKASLSSEGAFVQATKEVVQKGVESFMRNLSRALFADGTAKLGISVSGSDATQLALTQSLNSDGDTVITIDDMKEANFEERDLVDIKGGSGAGSSSEEAIEILAVDPENKQVVLKGDVRAAFLNNATPASATALIASEIYMQGSEDNDPDGLRGVLLEENRVSGKSYGITHARRWRSAQKIIQNSSEAISTDMLNEMMLKVKKQCGKSPNLIVASFKQYERILNLLESQKQYTVPTRAGLKSKSGADISFSGVTFMSVDGPVGIFPERFVADDTVYLLNDNHIHIHHRPDFGWFDDDGTVFLRKHDSDAYEARYGGYLEIYINPCFHGVITGLSLVDV